MDLLSFRDLTYLVLFVPIVGGKCDANSTKNPDSHHFLLFVFVGITFYSQIRHRLSHLGGLTNLKAELQVFSLSYTHILFD